MRGTPPPQAGAKKRSCRGPWEPNFWDLRPGILWVLLLVFVFVSELAGEDHGNLNFETASTRANRDFPEKPPGPPFGGEETSQTRKGALSGQGPGDPHRVRSATGPLGGGARGRETRPVARPSQAPGGWRPARACGLGQTLAPSTPPRPQAPAGVLGPRRSRARGRCSRRGDPRSRPRAPLGSRPRGRASC